MCIRDSCTLGGRVRSDFVVLEVDERFTPIVFSQIPLDIFLVNNLLRDQVVRNGNPDIILAKISEAVPHARRLVLNADDPISQQLGDGRSDNVTFGMARTSRSTDTCLHLTPVALLGALLGLIICNTPLSIYAQLGDVYKRQGQPATGLPGLPAFWRSACRTDAASACHRPHRPK